MQPPARSSFDGLPDDAYMRERQLVQRHADAGTFAPLPFSSTTLWRKVREGSFPAPKRLSARVTAWRVGDVRAWLNSKN